MGFFFLWYLVLWILFMLFFFYWMFFFLVGFVFWLVFFNSKVNENKNDLKLKLIL